jgi:hypothetical protein
LRLENVDTVLRGERLDGTCCRTQAATRRTVRLRQYKGNVMPGRDEPG